jgi:hypothetical protein
MRMLQRARALVALLATLSATTLGHVPSAEASLDIAGLYLRKVRIGERTFFQEGGWSRFRNPIDFFYETEWIPGAGSSDPRFGGLGGGDSDAAFAAWSVGGLTLLSRPRSDFQLTFFSMATGTQRATISSETMQILGAAVAPVFFVPFVPQAFKEEGTQAITQSITGFQLNHPWLTATYGLLTDERNGATVFRSFLETNVPSLFVSSSLVTAPGRPVERGVFQLRYDRATWVGEATLGVTRTEVNERRTFVHAGFDQLFGFLSAEGRMNTDGEFAEGRFGVHLTTFEPGRPERNGKFGFAYDFKLMASAVNPAQANLWAAGLGPDAISPGLNAEIYLQFPANYLLVALLVLGATAQDNEYDRAQTIQTAMDVAALSDEDDRVYAGLTLGVSRNDAETLREVPSALDLWHFYTRLRLFY